MKKDSKLDKNQDIELLGQKPKGKINYFLVAVLVVFAVAFVVIIFTKRPVNTHIVGEISINESWDSEGVFILDETIIPVNSNLNYFITLEDGERVRSGSAVGYYVTDEYAYQIAQMRDIDERIENLMQKEPSAVTTSDLKLIEKEIEIKTQDMNTALTSGEYNKATGLYEEINILAGRRYDILSSISSEQTEILTELKKERDHLEQSLGIQSYISSEVSGMVSRRIDGFEGRFSTETVLNQSSGNVLSYLEEVKLKKDEPAEETGNIRIIDNFDWMLVVKITAEQFQVLKEKKSIDVEIEGETFRCSVESIKGEGDNRILYLSSDDYCEQFLDKRYVGDIKLITKNYTGFGVPVESLVEVDGVTGVYVEKINDYDFEEVTVLGQDEEMAVVEGLSRFDEVVVNPSVLKVN